MSVTLRNVLMVVGAIAIVALIFGTGVMLATNTISPAKTLADGGTPQTPPPAPAPQTPAPAQPVQPAAPAQPAQPVRPPTVSQAGFNPNLFDAQSCGPEKNSLGGCIWDIGVHGSRNDMDNRAVAQVGILKGVSAQWTKGSKVANSSPNGRCTLVVLTPNSWFEDLTIVDARMEIYDVDAKDIGGWAKTLAIQAAFEQSANYKCPARVNFPEDFDVWGSPIPSPPAGMPGFNNNPTGGQPLPAPLGAQTQTGPRIDPVTGATTTDTVDGKPRVATRDTGGQTTFAAGDAVAGFKITIAGKNFPNCFFPSAPGNGTVIDGVVHPWAAEIANMGRCDAR